MNIYSIIKILLLQEKHIKHIYKLKP